MSMPTYNLQCDQCDFVVGSSRLWGNYLYQCEEGQFICHTQFGWCEDCSDMTPTEDFDFHSWELEEIDIRVDWLSSDLLSAWQALWNLLSKSRRKRQAELLSEIRLNTLALRHAHKRKGAERCLECGSHRVKPFDGKVEIKVADDSLVFTGENPTGFLHPGCGGQLHAHGNNMRLNIASETRIYSTDGILLRSFCE